MIAHVLIRTICVASIGGVLVRPWGTRVGVGARRSAAARVRPLALTAQGLRVGMLVMPPALLFAVVCIFMTTR